MEPPPATNGTRCRIVPPTTPFPEAAAVALMTGTAEHEMDNWKPATTERSGRVGAEEIREVGEKNTCGLRRRRRAMLHHTIFEQIYVSRSQHGGSNEGPLLSAAWRAMSLAAVDHVTGPC